MHKRENYFDNVQLIPNEEQEVVIINYRRGL
jgi:hypothetical protein